MHPHYEDSLRPSNYHRRYCILKFHMANIQYHHNCCLSNANMLLLHHNNYFHRYYTSPMDCILRLRIQRLLHVRNISYLHHRYCNISFLLAYIHSLHTLFLLYENTSYYYNHDRIYYIFQFYIIRIPPLTPLHILSLVLL